MQLRVVVPDLAERVLEEHAERERWPKTFTVKWRFRNTGQHRCGASLPLPAAARPGCTAQLLVRSQAPSHKQTATVNQACQCSLLDLVGICRNCIIYLRTA